MGILHIPEEKKKIEDYSEVQRYLQERGIHYEKWTLGEKLSLEADDKSILKAYEPWYRPYMEKKGYQTVDVVNVHPQTPNVDLIRQKFLREHTHTEDEVRFFVRGAGLFWFHLEGQPVFSVLCQEGDLLSVPAMFKHWFDLGDNPFVTAIRMFTDPAGWVANYTESGIDLKFPGNDYWPADCAG